VPDAPELAQELDVAHRADLASADVVLAWIASAAAIASPCDA
jgi:hypothetical protein